MEKTCPCGTKILVPPRLAARKKYCSKKCFYRFRKRPSGLTYNITKPNPASFKKGQTPWNKGIPAPAGLKQRWSEKKKGKHYSRRTEFKKGNTPFNKGKMHLRNEKHPKWRGDTVGYGALHSWVYRNLGKAHRCEYVLCTYPRKNASKKVLLYPKTFHWANISREYRRELSDWVQLCASCHMKYDRGLIEL